MIILEELCTYVSVSGYTEATQTLLSYGKTWRDFEAGQKGVKSQHTYVGYHTPAWEQIYIR